VFSVVSAALVDTQRCGKHNSAAVNQHAAIEEVVFSVGSVLRLHNGDYTQLQLDPLVKAGSNTSIVALRVVEGEENGTPWLGV
jgi:hypothetical protein